MNVEFFKIDRQGLFVHTLVIVKRVVVGQ